jgi:hypothetical protein
VRRVIAEKGLPDWDGSPRRRSMYLATVDCATSKPSLSSSPWMRGADDRTTILKLSQRVLADGISV